MVPDAPTQREQIFYYLMEQQGYKVRTSTDEPTDIFREGDLLVREDNTRVATYENGAWQPVHISREEIGMFKKERRGTSSEPVAPDLQLGYAGRLPEETIGSMPDATLERLIVLFR